MSTEAQDITIISEAPPSPYPALGFDVQEHGANLVINYGNGHFSVQAVTEEQMNSICHQWLSRHKEQKTH